MEISLLSFFLKKKFLIFRHDLKVVVCMYAHRGKKSRKPNYIAYLIMYVQVHHAGSFFSFFPFPHISYSVLTEYIDTYVKRAAAKKKKKRLTTRASERSRGLNFWDGRIIYIYGIWPLEELYIFEQYKKWQVATPLTRNDGDIHRWGKTREGKNNRNNINVKRREMSYFALHRSAHARERE